MIGSVGPKVSSVMHFIVWSTSTSTVGSKKRPRPGVWLPPASTRAPFWTASATWSLIDVHLRREGDRADLDRARPLGLAHPQLADFLGDFGDELVVDGLLDVDALDRDAGLARRSASSSRSRSSRPARRRRRRGRSSGPCRRAPARPGSAAARRLRRPCGRSCVEPVNMIMSTCSISAAPVSPRPVAICRTSSGRPHSRSPSASSSEVSGVISEGLRITLLPAISAGMQSPKEFVSG